MTRIVKQEVLAPFEVRAVSRRGIDLRLQYGQGGTRFEVNTAQRFVDGEPLSIEFLRRVAARFERIEARREQPLDEGTGQISWALLGGDIARAWVQHILTQQDGTTEKHDGKVFKCDVVKVDTDHRLVFGYAIICKVGEDDYYDVQDDNIPEHAMIDACTSFMKSDRPALGMHNGEPIGQVVYGFPLTYEIAAALDISVEKSGFIIGMQVADDDVLQKFESGEFTGFSIGGRRITDTELLDDAA